MHEMELQEVELQWTGQQIKEKKDRREKAKRMKHKVDLIEAMCDEENMYGLI